MNHKAPAMTAGVFLLLTPITIRYGIRNKSPRQCSRKPGIPALRLFQQLRQMF